MKSTTTTDQFRELFVREARGDFGEDGLGADLQWFADHWQTIRGLRNGEIELVQFPCQINCPELIPKDGNGKPWDVIKDVAMTITSVADLDFISFLKEKESHIGGEEMCKRAMALKANFGLSDGKFLLDHQGEIPKAIRDKYIILTGTKLRGPGGNLYVAYLSWDGDRWVLRWDWLDLGFDDFAALPRGKSK